MPYRLPDPDNKARYVRARFDEIARDYDRFNDLVTQGQHRWWKRALVKRLELAPGDWGLDLCCGTGDIALRALRRMASEGGKSGGGVIAADFSGGMLRIAQQRLHSANETAHGHAPGHGIVQADAMRLPFADGHFRFITVGYGLRNVADLPGTLTELLRVLKPGGLLASLDMGKVRIAALQPLFNLYFFHVVPWIGRLLQPGQEMFSYLPHSTTQYPQQDALADLMRERGFASVELVEFAFGASVIHLARKPA